jgi:hypothetical protein
MLVPAAHETKHDVPASSCRPQVLASGSSILRATRELGWLHSRGVDVCQRKMRGINLTRSRAASTA